MAFLGCLIVFAPLVSFLLAGIFGRLLEGAREVSEGRLKESLPWNSWERRLWESTLLKNQLRNKLWGVRFSQIVTCTGVALSFVASMILLCRLSTLGIGGAIGKTQSLWNWLDLPGFSLEIGLSLDWLSVTMGAMISFVSFWVHCYSLGYMALDSGFSRFLSLLSFFTFSMLLLVFSPNLLQLFFGWEGVGVASYLLIGYWYEKPAAAQAALKAFLVNRVADIGFILALVSLYGAFQTLDFAILFAKMASFKGGAALVFWGYSLDWISLSAGLLLIAAMGKSAQFGFHIWLPDAMEGPTPVSALIHAATLVTAGIFLLIRCAPLYELTPFLREWITFIGVFTALFGALLACVQEDIKRVIAYSTCSQLGYMSLAVGCSAYRGALFHLMTHAFFKALLFLGSGSVIHAMSGEQNIRKMGGLWSRIPYTYGMMWIGGLALCGIPFWAGYFSKDFILEAAYAHAPSPFIYPLGIAVTGLTAFYMVRLLLYVFHGESKADERVGARVHEPPRIMQISCGVLALASCGMGFATHWFFLESTYFSFLPQKMMGALAGWLKFLPVLVALGGGALAYFLLKKRVLWSEKVKSTFPWLFLFLRRQGYLNELYNLLIVRPSFALGRFLEKVGDNKIIEGMIRQLTKLSWRSARLVSLSQTGYVNHYAFSFLLGLAVLLSYFVVRGVIGAKVG